MSIKSLCITALASTMSLVSFTSAMQEETVVDIAMNSDVHTTLVSAVVAADLAETLSSDGPFTVFAPTNDAFSKLPAGTVEMLLEPENIDTLRSILTYHVIPWKVMADDLSQGLMADTVQGDSVTFTHTNNAWYVNSAKIIATDLVADNWVVHVIDSVINPPLDDDQLLWAIYEIRAILTETMEEKVDMALSKYNDLTRNMSMKNKMHLDARLMIAIDMYTQKSLDADFINVLNLLKYEILADLDAMSVVDAAVNSQMHTTLVTALMEANLVDTLSVDGPFTVFAPINSAFEKLPEGTLDKLLAEESKEWLRDILTYHVVAGAYMAWDITDGLMLETLNGESLQFTINNGVVSINGMSTLLMTDIMTSNGIVHVIDDVLIPGE